MQQEVMNQISDGMPLKKKRGRPRKTEQTFLQQREEKKTKHESSPATDLARKTKKPKVSQMNVEAPPSGDQNISNNQPPAKVGQSVHGVVDGSFETGFLVTLRVGDSDTIYRGVVFGPGLSIPVNRSNDVAAKVRSTKRDEEAVPLMSPISTSAVIATTEIHRNSVGFATPSTVSAEIYRNSDGFGTLSASVPGYGYTPSAFRSSLDHEMLNPMYSGVSGQINSSAAYFPARASFW